MAFNISAGNKSTQANQLLASPWERLQQEAASSNFSALIQEIYGVNASQAGELRQRILAGKLSMPKVVVLGDKQMQGALGAYSPSGLDGQATIYVNRQLLARSSDPQQLQRVLLEEIGHHLDQVLNGATDTPGDEGELFSRRLLGEELTVDQISILRSENDAGIVRVNERLVAVENAIRTSSISSVQDNVGIFQDTNLTNGATTDDQTLTFRGLYSSNSTSTGNTLYLWARNASTGSITRAGSTSLSSLRLNSPWTITSASLPAGTYTFFVNNISTTPTTIPASGTRTYTIDTQAPSLTARVTGVEDNEGLIKGNVAAGGFTDDTTLVIRGALGGATAGASLAPGETLRIYDGNAFLGTADVTPVANGQSIWTLTTTALAQGSHAFTVRIADAAGNQSVAGTPYSLTVDSVAPTARASVTTATDNEGGSTGPVGNGAITDDTTPTLSGTFSLLGSGEAVAVFATVNGTATYLGNAQIITNSLFSRTWQFTPTSPLSAGSYTFSARVIDQAGNIGPATGSTLSFRIAAADTIAPVFTSGNTATLAENSGAGQVVYTATATDASAISYSLKSGGDASLFSINSSSGAVTLSGNPDFETKPSYSFTVVATDTAGNASERAVSLAITNVNEAVTDLSLLASTIAENTVIGTGVQVGVISITDPDATGNSNVLSIEGADAGSFEIRNGNQLFFTGTTPDFETKSSYAITIKAADGSLVYSKEFTINVTDVAEFVVSEANGVVSFSGTATGDITLTVDSTGVASFARGGGTAQGTVTGLFNKQLAVNPGTGLLVNVSGTATNDTFTLNAPQAGIFSFSGDLGAGNDEIVIRIADQIAGFETRNLTVNMSGLSAGETLAFVFEATAGNGAGENDTIVLTANSVIANGITTLKVRTGTVDFTKVTLPAGINFDIQSGAVLSYSQFINGGSVISLTGTGELTLSITAAEISALGTYLTGQQSNQTQYLIGVSTIVKVDGVTVDLTTPPFTSIRDGLAAISSPGIPQLSDQLDALQAKVNSLTIADIGGLATQLGQLNAAITLLQTGATSVDARLTALEGQLVGIVGTVTNYVDTQVQVVQTRINNLSVADINGLATDLGNLNAAINALQAVNADARLTVLETQLVGIVGTVTNYVDQQVQGVQDRITNLTVGDIGGLATDLLNINNAIGALQAINADVRLNALETQVAGFFDVVKAYVDGQVQGVQTRIDNLSVADIGGLATDLLNINNAIGALQVINADARLTNLEGQVAGFFDVVKAYVDQQVQGVQDRITNLTVGDIGGLATDLLNINNAIGALQAINADVRLNALEGQVAGFFDVVKDYVDGQVQGVQTRIDNLSVADIGGLATDLLNINNAIGALQVINADARLTNLEGQVAGFFDVVKAYVDGQVQGVQTRIDNLSVADIGGLATDLLNINNAIGALQAINADVRLTNLEGQVAGFFDVVKDYVDGQVQGVQTRIDNLSVADIGGLATDLLNINNAIGALQVINADARLTNLEGQVAGFFDVVKDYVDQQVQGVQDRITNLTVGDIGGLATDLLNINNAIGALQVINADARLNALETQVAGFFDVVKDYVDQQVQSVQTRIDNLSVADIGGLATDLLNINNAIGALQAINADVRLNALETQVAGFFDVVKDYVDGQVQSVQTRIDNLSVADIGGLATDLLNINNAIGALQAINADVRLNALETQVAGFFDVVKAYVDGQVQGVQDRITNLTVGDIGGLATDLLNINNAIGALQAINADVRLNALEGQVAGFFDVVKDYVDGQVQGVQTRIDNLSVADIGGLATDLLNINNAIGALQVINADARLTNLEGQVAGFFDVVKAYVDGQVQGVQTRIDNLSVADIGGLATDLLNINNAIGALQAINADVRLNALETQVAGFFDVVKDYVDGQVQSVQTRIDNLSVADIGGLATDLLNINNAIGALQAINADVRLNALETQVAGFFDVVKAYVDGQVQGVQDRITNLTVGDIGGLATDLLNINNAIGALQAINADVRLNALETQVAGFFDVVKDYVDQQVQSVQTRIDNLSVADIGGLATDLLNINNAIGALQAINADVRLNALETQVAGFFDVVKAYVDGQVQGVQTRIDNLSVADIGGLATDLLNINNAIGALQVINADARLTNLEGQVAGFFDVVKAYVDQQVQGVQDRITNLTVGDIGGLATDLLNINNAIGALQAINADVRLNALEGQVAGFFDVVKDYVDGQVQGVQTRIDNLSVADIGGLATDLLNINNAIGALQVINADARLTNLEGQVAGFFDVVKDYVDGQVQGVQTRIDNLSVADIGGLATDLLNINNAIGALQVINADARLTNLEGQVAGFFDVVKDYVDQQVQGVQDRITNLTVGDIGGLATDLLNINDAIGALQAINADVRLNALEGQVAGFFDVVKAYVDGQVQGVQTRIDNLSVADIGGLATDLLNINNAIGALQAINADVRLNALETQVAGFFDVVKAYVDAQVQAVQTRIDNLTVADIDNLATDLFNLNAAIAALQAIDADARLNTLETQVAGSFDIVKAYVDAAVQGLQGQIDTLAIADITGLAAELTALNGAITALQGVDTATDGRLDALETQLAGIVGTVINYVDGKVADLSGDLTISEYKTVADLSAAVTTLENAVGKPAAGADPASGLYAEIANLQAKIGTLIANLNALAPSINTIASDDVVNGTEATAGITISGVAIPGNRVFLSFTSGLQSAAGFNNSVVAAAVTGEWSITLNAAQVALLGQGAETITAVQTTPDGFVSDPASTTIQIDTLAPDAVTLALGNGVNDGATLSEATASGGVVTVTGDLGNAINITFKGTSGVITKTLTGLGTTPIAVVLTTADVATLGQGAVNVNATQTDGAGNVQNPATTNTFTIDSVAPTATLSANTITSAGNASVQSSEAGTAYLVNTKVNVTSLASITSATGDLWNSVEVTANNATNLAATGLINGTYKLYSVDAAGNLSAASADTLTIDTPVFAGDIRFVDLTDTGSSDIGTPITRDNNFSLRRVGGNAGDTVEFERSINQGATWTSLGAGVSTQSGLVDREYWYRAKVTSGGNTTYTAPISVIIDRKPDAAPVITGITDDTGFSDIDAITSDTTPTLTINAAPNSIVQVRRGGVLLGEADETVVPGVYEFAVESLVDGTYQFTVSSVDAAGNVSDNGSITVIVDTTSPTPGFLSFNGLDNTGITNEIGTAVTQDGTFTLSLADNFDANGTSVVYQRSADGGTTWLNTTAAQTALGDGSYQFRAQVTDPAGNESYTAPISVIVDNTAPVAGVLTFTDLDNTGITDEEGTAVTQDGTFTLSLADNFDANGTSVVYQRSADGGTTWLNTTAAQTALGDGSYQFRAQVTDPAGNESYTAPISVIVDNTAPVAGVLTFTDLDNTGITDEIGTAVTQDGTFTLSLADNFDANGTSVVYQRSADGGTTWLNTTAAQTALGDGSYQFRAQVTDPAGNESYTVPISVIVDNTAPVAGVLTFTDLDNTGITDEEGTAVTQDGTFTLSLADNFDANGTSVVYQRSADGGTTWLNTTAAQTALGDGSYQFRAQVTDPAGNESYTAPISVIVDNTAPVAGVLTFTDLDNTGITDEEGTAVTQDGTFTLSLADNFDANGTSVVYQRSADGGTTWLNTTAAQTALGDGSYQFRAQVTDPAGNESYTAPISVIVDNTAPVAGVLTFTDLDNTGITDEEGTAVTQDGTFTLSLADNFDANGTSVVYQRSADGGTTWLNTTAAQTALGDGSYQFRAQVTDPAGNESYTAPISVIVDNTAPVAGVLTFTDLDNTGITDEEGTAVTKDGTFTLSLADNFDANGTSVVYQRSADGGTTWLNTTAAQTALGDGSYQFRAQVTDPAGNESYTAPISVIVDNTAPVAGVLTFTDLDNTGITNEIGTTVTKDGTFTLSLADNFDANGTSVVYQRSADGGTTWLNTTAAQTALGDGSYQFRAQVTDPAGNESYTAPISVIVDNTAPVAGVLTFTDLDNTGITNEIGTTVTKDGTFTLSLAGNVDTNGTSVVYQRSADGGTTWLNTTAAQTALGDGSYQFRAQVTDPAGNESYTVPISVIVDNTAPVAPTLTLPADTGSIDGITANQEVTVEGLEPSAIWEYKIKDDSWTQGSGVSFLLAADETYAIGDIKVRQTDQAGNTSAEGSYDTAITTDNTAPVAGVLTFTDLDNTGITDEEGTAVTQDGTFTLSLADNFDANGTSVVYQRSADGGTTWLNTTAAQTALGDGSYQFRAQVTDPAGNESYTAPISVIVDNTAPVAGVLTFTDLDNTGITDEEGTAVTQDGTFTLSLADNFDANGTSVVYQRSADGGTTWLNTTAAQTALGDGNYQFRAQVTDPAGNESYTVPISVIVDNTAPVAPTLTLPADTGSIDGITANQEVTVEGLEPSAIWEYKIKDGSWTQGSGVSFLLAADETYAIGDIKVRQTDQAGNTSEVGASLAAITTDNTNPEIASVTIPAGTYKVGSEIPVTITAIGSETGLTLSTAVFNGQALSNITNNNNGTYTGTYTVQAGDDDVALNDNVTTDLVFTDPAGNTSQPFTSVTLAGASIDANPPSPTITSLSYDNSTDSFTIVGTNLGDGTRDLSKLVYNFGGVVTRTFTASEFSSQNLVGDTLTLTLTATASQAIEGNARFAATGDGLDDSFTLQPGFLTDSAGNTSATVISGALQFDWAPPPSFAAAFTGGSNADRIAGSALGDILVGGDGSDTIRGAGGADVLTGGNGDDRFVYLLVADSTAFVRDTITDFGTVGTDVIDLGAILGGGSASPTALTPADSVLNGTAGEFGNNRIAFFFDAPNNNTLVYIDAVKDNQFDAAADMQILMAGQKFLTTTNFLV